MSRGAATAEGSGGETRVPRALETLHEQWESPDKQRHAAHLGMWVFIATEVLLFGALFALYAGYRLREPVRFAEAAHHTSLWIMTAGTVVLLLASFLVAWSVHAIRADRASVAGRLLASSSLLAASFLALKLWEYRKHWEEGLLPAPWFSSERIRGPAIEAFFNLYYLMTGLHFVHVLVGMGVLAWLARRARRLHFDATWHTPLELGGVYWHFVDVVWLFIWPFFYLMR